MSNQIFTASYDHYCTFVSGPACKHKNPIWRTAAVFNIVRVAIIQPYIDQFWWNLVCRCIIIMVPGGGLVIKTGTGSTNCHVHGLLWERYVACAQRAKWVYAPLEYKPRCPAWWLASERFDWRATWRQYKIGCIHYFLCLWFCREMDVVRVCKWM